MAGPLPSKRMETVNNEFSARALSFMEKSVNVTFKY